MRPTLAHSHAPVKAFAWRRVPWGRGGLTQARRVRITGDNMSGVRLFPGDVARRLSIAVSTNHDPKLIEVREPVVDGASTAGQPIVGSVAAKSLLGQYGGSCAEIGRDRRCCRIVFVARVRSSVLT
jgi:hypothetical protein